MVCGRLAFNKTQNHDDDCLTSDNGKQRFRCLKHMCQKSENSLTTIVATACLHNIAKDRSIPLQDAIENDGPQEAEMMPFYVPETIMVRVQLHGSK